MDWPGQSPNKDTPSFSLLYCREDIRGRGTVCLTCARSNPLFPTGAEAASLPPSETLHLWHHACRHWRAGQFCSQSRKMFAAFHSQERSAAWASWSGLRSITLHQELWSPYLWLTSAATHLPQAQQPVGLEENCSLGFGGELYTFVEQHYKLAALIFLRILFVHQAWCR